MANQCPACGAQNAPAAQFCNQCGGALKSVCRHCGHANSPTARFCSGCGKPVQAAPAQVTSAQAPPVQITPSVQITSAARSVTGALAANSVVASRYLITRMLGQGGMGAVYLVADQRTSSKRALKEMSDQKLTDPAERQQALDGFRQEAQLLANLDHPNLPKVMDFFSDQGNQYLVMEFVEGETLEKRLQRAGGHPMPEPEVRKIVHQLIDVLDYLHDYKPPIIFRDLKPANIMIQPDGRIKLIDFGIARHFKPGKSKDTQAMGTPGYAAPEQYGKGQSDARTDIFALGAVTHHMLSGRDPSGDPFNFPPLRLLNPNISPSIETVVQRALDLLPAQRWQSVKEIRSALTGGLPQGSLGGTLGAAGAPGLPPTTVMATPPAPYSYPPAPPSLPGQMGSLPGQMGSLPGQMGSLPGQMGSLPGQIAPLAGSIVPPPLPSLTPQASPRMSTASSTDMGVPQFTPMQWPGDADASSWNALAPNQPIQIPLLGQVPAAPGRRLGALLVDLFLLYLASILAGGVAAELGWYTLAYDAPYLIPLLLLWVMMIWPVARTGRTLGKKALGIRIIGEDGSPPGYGRALLRYAIGYPLSWAVFGLGFLWVLWDANKQAWHDKIAGTYVVEV